MELRNVTGMNITLSDRVDGPFSLEIQGCNSIDSYNLGDKLGTSFGTTSVLQESAKRLQPGSVNAARQEW